MSGYTRDSGAGSGYHLENNLILNKKKTKEIVFHNRGRKPMIPPPTDGIERVTKLVKLGVTIQDSLSMKEHINAVLSSCTNMLYAMNILKMHGLPPSGLQQVFNAKVLSKLTYASPAWCGLMGRDDVGRIDSFLRRAKKFGYYSQDGKMFDELCLKADDELFKKVRTNTNHVLHRFLPEQKQVHYDLRKRKHSYVLPDRDDRNFINRILFK